MVVKKSDIDMDHIMSYPITQCPLSISHPDGGPLTTPKSKMLEVLEPLQDVKLTEHDICNTTATVIDGGLLIHAKLAVVKKIGTYGNFAWSVLKTACREVGKEVHILSTLMG